MSLRIFPQGYRDLYEIVQMKNATHYIGYITAFAITVTAVLKFTHLPGAGEALSITGLLLGIYFPVFIIAKAKQKTQGRTLPSHVAAAICVSLMELGITFRLGHWPGASLLLVLGLAGFSLVFIPILLIQKSKETGADHIMNWSGGLGLAAFALGTLFKLQHWPGAAMLLIVSPLLLFLVYFPKYTFNRSISIETKSKYLLDSFFIIVIGTLIALYFIKSIEIHDNNNYASQTNGLTEIIKK